MDTRDSRLRILLRVPLSRSLIALACLAHIIELSEVYLADLFLPISGLAEASRLRQMSDGLRQRLDSHCDGKSM